MRYRRADTKGGTYFFTVNLAERSNALLIDEIDKLRCAINRVKKKHPFKLGAMVILPEHLHAIFTLQPCKTWVCKTSDRLAIFNDS